MALTKISHDDNDKAVFGTSEDLQIFHNGSNTYLANSTGLFQLKNTAGNIDLLSWNDTLLRVNAGEMAVDCSANSSVDLYYDNSKKFETTASGVDCPDQLQVDGTTFATGGLKINADNIKLRLGASDDLELYHDATNSVIDNKTGDLYIKSVSDVFITPGTTEAGVYIRHNGAVELYYDNSKKFQTESWGAQFFDDVKFDNPDTAGRDVTWSASNDYMRWQDGTKAVFGGGEDLQIYHNGSDNIINDQTNSSLRIQNAGNNIWEFGNGFLKGNDGKEIILGDSSDLKIYHSGTHGYLQNDTGTLRLESPEVGILSADGSETMAQFVQNGAVSLRYDNSTKLETTSAGITVTGSANSATELRIENTNNSQNAAIAKLSLHGGDAANQGPIIELDRNGAYHQIEEDASGNLDFNDNGTVKFIMQSDGDFQVCDGDLVIGTAGHGIDFSAQTASSATGAVTSAEILDHYEEGSWTANILGASSTGSVSYSNNDCWYTRIGRQVTICYYINWSSGTGSGHLNVHGLPFTVSTSNQYAGSVMCNNLDWPNGNANGTNIVTHTWGGVNYFRLYASQDNGGWQAMQCDAEGAIIGTMTYFTNA